MRIRRNRRPNSKIKKRLICFQQFEIRSFGIQNHPEMELLSAEMGHAQPSKKHDIVVASELKRKK